MSPLFGTECAEEQARPTQNFGGRPRESTLVNKKKREKNLDVCICEIGNVHVAKKKECPRAPNNCLRETIDAQKEVFGISLDALVSENAIRSRKKRASNTSKKGPVAPLASVEPALIAMCLQMALCRQPLNASDETSLMNGLIDNSVAIQENLISFKVNSNTANKDARNPGEVTKSWWAGILDHHSDVLETKRGQPFESSRTNGTKLPFVVQMHDVTCTKMADDGAAVSMDEVFTIKEGEIVSEQEKCGRATTIKITHPKPICMMDETGCNALQNKDGLNASENKIVGVGNVPRTESNRADHRRTLLPMTSATGEAIMCVATFQSEQKAVPARWQSGIDVRVQPENDEMGETVMDETTTNHGAGKHLPGGPACACDDKMMPRATRVSESEGTTAGVLVDVLAVLDKLDAFPRDSGIDPFMVLDGHSSRSDPKFLAHINNCDHRWKACLGLPHATSLWQLGDGKEQNGTFKGEWHRAKTSLFVCKAEFNLDLKIMQEDVMPLLNRVFQKSHNRVE